MWYEKLFFVCTLLRYLTFKAFFKCIVGSWQILSWLAGNFKVRALRNWGPLPCGSFLVVVKLGNDSYLILATPASGTMKGARIYTDIQENKLTGERHIFYRRLYYSPSLFSECKIQSFHFYPWQPCRKVTPQLPGWLCKVAHEAWHGGSFSAVGDVRGSGSVHKTNYTNYSTPKCEQ